MEKIKLGIIGLGQRGSMLLDEIVKIDDVEVCAVCDSYSDRTKDASDKIRKKC